MVKHLNEYPPVVFEGFVGLLFGTFEVVKVEDTEGIILTT
jgi:hypothetical protein